jgi:AcrR family transcriptional regulator
MPRHKKEDRNQIVLETRALILEAAANEFAIHGFAGANVNRIAEAAGFSIGTVYNYFPSKRDLMFGFIKDTGSLHIDFIVTRVMQADTPSHRLEVLFQAGFDFEESNVIPSKAIFNALNGPDLEFREYVNLTYQPLFQLVSSEIISPGITQGEFRPVNPRRTAQLIMLIYLGTGSQLSPEGKLWASAAEVADFVLNALLLMK